MNNLQRLSTYEQFLFKPLADQILKEMVLAGDSGTRLL